MPHRDTSVAIKQAINLALEFDVEVKTVRLFKTVRTLDI